ncbi:hypothetical protein WUBG_02760 [Wuchereria bancrofti]|uniref:Uncharacterized protein n=1 Tax=Wuchereria bancrofti TaxID=6293 RepID=J9BGB0_WUCBA|nr:hypothetical protein WUBG_02760 [Wuchereria bancrofti]VDM09014.1 unnamed protein product [Wuchereria bancrofti]
MDNETILAYMEKIAITETSIATVTAVITDDWSQWKWDDAVVKFFENSTNSSIRSNDGFNVTPITTSSNSTLQNFFNTINDWNIFEEIPWFIWILIGAGTSLIIVVLITVIIYLELSKNRKSRRSNGSDQGNADSSDNISQFMWPRWMLCCPKSIFDRQENLRMMRQNSASNLDPYRRPPLPSLNNKDISDDEFRSNFFLSRHMESLSMTKPHLNTLAAKAEHMLMLSDAQDGSGSHLFTINMTGNRGVPVVQNDRSELLPVSSPGCVNHL